MHCSRSKTLLVLIFLFGMFTFAFAQEGENITPFASVFDYWDFGYEVASADDYLVVATGRTGIRITSYQDGEGISELSSWNTPGRALDLVVRDGVIFVADGSAGLRIIDFRNHLFPKKSVSWQHRRMQPESPFPETWYFFHAAITDFLLWTYPPLQTPSRWECSQSKEQSLILPLMITTPISLTLTGLKLSMSMIFRIFRSSRKSLCRETLKNWYTGTAIFREQIQFRFYSD